MVNATGTCLGPAPGGGGIREAGDTIIAESLVGYNSTRKRAAGRSIG